MRNPVLRLVVASLALSGCVEATPGQSLVPIGGGKADGDGIPPLAIYDEYGTRIENLTLTFVGEDLYAFLQGDPEAGNGPSPMAIQCVDQCSGGEGRCVPCDAEFLASLPLQVGLDPNAGGKGDCVDTAFGGVGVILAGVVTVACGFGGGALGSVGGPVGTGTGFVTGVVLCGTLTVVPAARAWYRSAQQCFGF